MFVDLDGHDDHVVVLDDDSEMKIGNLDALNTKNAWNESLWSLVTTSYCLNCLHDHRFYQPRDRVI